ncbi:hypothetical protein RGQ15_09570 [Paracoccus sp. MBLB3053]|uniref:XRE family transcriptional regulator n=1 Tax=Paracoccus aurantius TaxID=3073814 RepID=A0ABU2HRY7_9RHOB|nr:hypothetical protein [Paracoccus sp. MBLB3053]MDS9467815.1 hypothetical protein [Paracoccus sp. MBLB3053]
MSNLPEPLLRQLRGLPPKAAQRLAQRMAVPFWMIESWAEGGYVSERMQERLIKHLEALHEPG